MTENLTHNTLPQGVANLIKEVSELKRLLIEKQEQPIAEQPKQFLSVYSENSSRNSANKKQASYQEFAALLKGLEYCNHIPPILQTF